MSREPAGKVRPAPTDVTQVLDHLFRREFGRLVAILARRFGVSQLHLAEDVVQDALVRAMQVWPYSGVPENPTAWLLQTARNRALDQTRRAGCWRDKQASVAALVEDCASTAAGAQFEDEIADSQLRMMFVCCQPGLPADAQTALILKTLCGFGEREIAAAFLASEEAIAKKLVRARRHLRDARVEVELPPAAELAPRVETLLHALYLLFNEGYKASHGDSLLRADLCAEAIRLGELLAAHAIGDRPVVASRGDKTTREVFDCNKGFGRPATHALLALMHLHTARLPARIGDDGSLLVLAAQDRSRWDLKRIQLGLACLARSGAGTQITRWHVEAGIAACHALAPHYEATNWPHILELYDLLLTLDASSPIVALNRAIALAKVRGAAAGLEALAGLAQQPALARYHLYHAVRGQLLFDARRHEEAALALRRALELAVLPAERTLLERRLAELPATATR